MAHYTKEDISKVFSDKIKYWLDRGYFIDPFHSSGSHISLDCKSESDRFINSSANVEMVTYKHMTLIGYDEEYPLDTGKKKNIIRLYAIKYCNGHSVNRFYTDDKEEYECFKEEIQRLLKQYRTKDKIEQNPKVKKYQSNWKKSFGWDDDTDLELYLTNLIKNDPDEAFDMFFEYS